MTDPLDLPALYARPSGFFHHEDGSHRSTAPTADGHMVSKYAKAIARHLADGHSHEKRPIVMRAVNAIIGDIGDMPDGRFWAYANDGELIGKFSSKETALISLASHWIDN